MYCHEFYFTNSPWYYLTPYQNLLRLNITFMVKTIGQLLLNGLVGVGSLQHPPSDLKNFSHPKNEPTAKKLVWTKSSSHSREKLKKPVGRGRCHPSPLAIGGLKTDRFCPVTALNYFKIIMNPRQVLGLRNNR